MVRFVAIVLGFLVLTGCSLGNGSVVLNDAERRAIQSGFDAIEQDRAEFWVQAMPQYGASAREAHAQMRAAYPPAPRTRQLVQANVTKGSGGRTAIAVYEVSGGGRFLLVQARTDTQGGATKLTGFHVQPLAQSALAVGRFDPKAHGAKGYAMILAVLAALATTLAGLWRIWRRNLGGRRWMWTLGALFGVGSIQMNWATGDTAFQLLHVQLFSAGAFKAALGPWILAASIPFVAIWALLAPTYRTIEEPVDPIAD